MTSDDDNPGDDPTGPTGPTPLVRLRGITKRFGPVTVLDDARLDVMPGEVHVLAGENGAGKSTLIKILGGVHGGYDGTVEIAGPDGELRAVRPASPLDAAALGVAVIWQELSLVPSMTVVDNVFLGRTLTSGGFVRDGEQRREVRRLLDRLGIGIDPSRRVEDLPIGTQQLVEIVKAMAQDARVIVMDEPTSALTAPEVEKLFGLIADLKARGCGIVYITHKIEEIGRLADRITVMRDGRFVGSAPAGEMPIPELVRLMVGREVDGQFPRHFTRDEGRRLEVEGLTVVDPADPTGRPAVDGVDLHVRRGEILGIGGLQGSGASQLFLGLFGAFGGRAVGGTVRLDGEGYAPSSPARAIDAGVALLTNDRKATGLVLSLPIVANTTLAALGRVCRGGWRLGRRERELSADYASAFGLRAASLSSEVGSLSGGNQQKVALAKWLATEPRVLMLDEPTRGIDIGAKREIYQLMNEWTARGISLLLVTSELPELLAMSDRIVVMYRGRISAEIARADATADGVLAAAMGNAAGTGTATGEREAA